MSEIRSRRMELRRIAQGLAIGLLLASFSLVRSADTVAPARTATLVELSGPIGPAMSRYVEHSLADAENQHSSVVILQMDTPGGLDTSMRDIIKAILASPVPVVTYVAPSGARAASAGTYILYASHLAAMAPATNVGAATPISIGGEPSTPPSPQRRPIRGERTKKQKGPEEIPAGTAGERKAVNDAVAYIRSLAQLRGRNADWAEAAVRGAASLSADDALEQHVIDIVAKDVPDLLQQLQGRKVRRRTTSWCSRRGGSPCEDVAPDWRTRALLILTHPTIAYGLLLIGIYGLLLEGYNPGAVLPGVVGALSLLLGLYGLQLLAVNYRRPRAHGARNRLDRRGILHAGIRIAWASAAWRHLSSVRSFCSTIEASGLRVALPLIVGIAVAGGLVIAQHRLAGGPRAAPARRAPASRR